MCNYLIIFINYRKLLIPYVILWEWLLLTILLFNLWFKTWNNNTQNKNFSSSSWKCKFLVTGEGVFCRNRAVGTALVDLWGGALSCRCCSCQQLACKIQDTYQFWMENILPQPKISVLLYIFFVICNFMIQ